jgi:hypothetical protein
LPSISIEILGNNEEIDNLIEPSEEILYNSLLTLFFSGNFTQSAFKLLLEHTQLFTNIKLPKSIDQIITKIEEEKLTYSKKWYCQNCKEEVNLENNKQRNCFKCLNK